MGSWFSVVPPHVTESRAQGTGVGRDIRQSPSRVRSVFLLIYGWVFKRYQIAPIFYMVLKAVLNAYSALNVENYCLFLCDDEEEDIDWSDIHYIACSNETRVFLYQNILQGPMHQQFFA